MSTNMTKLAPAAVLLLAALEAFPAAAEASDQKKAATISLEVAGRQRWSLGVEPDRLVGDQNVLQREDDVVFGFLRNQRVRLKLKERHSGSRLVGGKNLLSYHRTGGEIHLTGLFQGNQVEVRLDDRRLWLSDSSISATLRPAESRGARLVLSDPTGNVRLILEGCDLDTLRNRPELLFMLNRMTLRWLAYHQDVHNATPRGW